MTFNLTREGWNGRDLRQEFDPPGNGEYMSHWFVTLFKQAADWDDFGWWQRSLWAVDTRTKRIVEASGLVGRSF